MKFRGESRNVLPSSSSIISLKRAHENRQKVIHCGGLLDAPTGPEKLLMKKRPSTRVPINLPEVAAPLFFLHTRKEKAADVAKRCEISHEVLFSGNIWVKPTESHTEYS